MVLSSATGILLFVAGIPFIYYLLVIFSSFRFFRSARARYSAKSTFTPAASILKPVRGLDPEAYENFASFCHQDYPEYEIIFCVGDADDPALPVIEKLIRDYPEQTIRVIYRSGLRNAPNDKVVKLDQLVHEAKFEYLVINDSDVRVQPDYLRSVIAPLARPEIGGVTCLYVAAHEKTGVDRIQSIGMISDMYAGILVAWQLDGVKFALGETIVTTRTRLAEFGGYRAIEHRPADDLLIGRLIAQHGHEVELLPYAVQTVADYGSLSQLYRKRLRWMVVMRHMRPSGHLGLLLTLGLPWSLFAILIHPTLHVAAAFLGTYLLLRFVMTWLIGIWGMKQSSLWRNLILIPFWDALATAIWVGSFIQNDIRWRDGQYRLQNGMMVQSPSAPAE